MDRVFLKDKEEKRIRLGHPWIFDNEIGQFQGPCADGTSVEVMSKSGLFLGRGIINRKSRITVRLFTRNREEFIDRAFFERRIANACALRAAVFSPEDSYRLLFAEADLVPGLVCDRFVSTDGDVFLSIQFLTLGVDTFRDDIISVLREQTGAKGIFERSDVHVRGLDAFTHTGSFALNAWKGWAASVLAGGHFRYSR